MDSRTIRIWVDADSFPAKARDLLLRTAARHKIPVSYVANREIPFSMEDPLFEMRVCKAGPDAADDEIAGKSTAGDIVLTRDIPLAARLVEKGVSVMNDRGTIFDKRTVEKRLKERELSLQMEMLGLHSGYRHESYGSRELEAFSQCLNKLIMDSYRVDGCRRL